MNPDQENFERLRRLLTLKRFEQPPAGFYSRFPREVIQRIRAGERGEKEAALDRLFAEPRWLQRLLGALETKPAVAGAFGLAMCGLLVAGVLYSENIDTAGAGLTPVAEPMPGAVHVTWFSQPGIAQDRPTSGVFTNVPVIPPARESLFDPFQNLNRAVPAAFQLEN